MNSATVAYNQTLSGWSRYFFGLSTQATVGVMCCHRNLLKKHTRHQYRTCVNVAPKFVTLH